MILTFKLAATCLTLSSWFWMLVIVDCTVSLDLGPRASAIIGGGAVWSLLLGTGLLLAGIWMY